MCVINKAAPRCSAAQACEAEACCGALCICQGPLLADMRNYTFTWRISTASGQISKRKEMACLGEEHIEGFCLSSCAVSASCCQPVWDLRLCIIEVRFAGAPLTPAAVVGRCFISGREPGGRLHPFHFSPRLSKDTHVEEEVCFLLGQALCRPYGKRRGRGVRERRREGWREGGLTASGPQQTNK